MTSFRLPKLNSQRQPRLYISNTNFCLSCSNEDTVRRMIQTLSQTHLYDYGGISYSSATTNGKERCTVSIDKRCRWHKDVRREIWSVQQTAGYTKRPWKFAVYLSASKPGVSRWTTSSQPTGRSVYDWRNKSEFFTLTYVRIGSTRRTGGYLPRVNTARPRNWPLTPIQKSNQQRGQARDKS